MIQFIVVPYDSGRRAQRMGRGPERLLACGLAEQLSEPGRPATVSFIEANGDAVDSAFEIAHKVAQATRSARAARALPVILAGNCITSVGGFAGLGSNTAMLWLDAHADFNTPDTSPSGFLDGMALAVMTGRCHADRTQQLDGFCALPDSELVLLGTRSIDEGEAPVVEQVAAVGSAAELDAALARTRRDDLYLHVDLDVLDPSSLQANQFATPGGLSTADLLDCIAVAARAKRIAAIAITAYDPDADRAQAAPAIVLELLRRALVRPT